MGKSTEKPISTPQPEAIEHEATQPNVEPSNRKPGKKRLGWVQFNTYIPNDLRTEVKIKAVREDVDLSDVVSQLLQEWVQK
jgi:hypothetical protein